MTTADLLAAIGRAKNRNEAARAYKMGLVQQRADDGRAWYEGKPFARIDWPAVNAAILERWTMSGLKAIKTWAWKMDRMVGE